MKPMMPVTTRQSKKMASLNNECDIKSECDNSEIEANEILYTKENEKFLISILKSTGHYIYVLIKFLIKISGVYLKNN